MRFKIVLNALDNKIPIGNRFMICSLLKNAIEKGDKELFNEIYYFQDKKNKKIKDFTFAIYLNDYDVKESYIDVYGDISVTITTPNYNFGIALYNGLLSIKEFNYKEKYSLAIKKIILLKENKVKNNEVKCKTLSPIYIKDKDNKPVEIQNDNFEELINYISDIYLKSYRGYGLREKLKFKPISMKKVVIKEEISRFKEETKKDYIFINGYKGIFNLMGDIEDLNILLQSGIGFRRSEGFGLIDLI
ncbi:CRISPR-associated endoribonuclease Cas6 [Clostridium botulinum]|nr:CRISPR-associated endoribonuclease Cas6 [Clostridium botulinum]